MRGHDGDAFSGVIYFDGVKVCEVFDDSRGGELDIRNVNPKLKIEDIYSKIDKDSLYDKEYKWTTTIDLLLHEVVNIHRALKEKTKGVLIGTPNRYRIEGFQYTIKTCYKKWSDVGEHYQKIIDKVEKNGENILNKDYLKSFGLKVK